MEGWDPEEHPRSVLSGRTNDEVMADPDFLWRSDLQPPRRSVSLLPEPVARRARRARRPRQAGHVEVFGRQLEVTNLDKVLFPGDPPVTKRELLAYAARIAPLVLALPGGPGAQPAPLPRRRRQKGFWHKAAPATRRTGCRAGTTPRPTRARRQYLVADEPAALVWAANFGALEWHPWTSRIDAPHEPTYALVDLDPGRATTWDDLSALARLHRTALDHLGVTARPKVTGRRGIQIWVPVVGRVHVRRDPGVGRAVSRTVGGVVPELVSWKWEIKARGGLARLDYTQNAINKTLVAPYARGRHPGARSRRRSLGRARRPGAAARPMDDPHDPRPIGERATCSGHCWAAPSNCPSCCDAMRTASTRRCGAASQPR